MGFGTSNDWSVSRAYFENSTDFFANVGIGPHYTTNEDVRACSPSNNCVNSRYEVMNVFTNNPGAASYDLKYKHKLSLCAGISYDVSGWARTQRASMNRFNPEGCRITALLDGQMAFTERIGYWDWPEYRYLHGVITPSKNLIAELIFRIDCNAPKVSGPVRPRGIK